MLPDFKNVLFPVIESFKQEGGLEWTSKLKDLSQDELIESLESIHDTVKNLTYHAALLPGLDEEKRENLIGKLVVSAAQLFHIPGRSNQSELDKAVINFETTLKNLIRQDWITHANERFEEFEKAYEAAEEGADITPEQIDNLRPVFFAFDLFETITFQPGAENEDEDDDELGFEIDLDDLENDEEESN